MEMVAERERIVPDFEDLASLSKDEPDVTEEEYEPSAKVEEEEKEADVKEEEEEEEADSTQRSDVWPEKKIYAVVEKESVRFQELCQMGYQCHLRLLQAERDSAAKQAKRANAHPLSSDHGQDRLTQRKPETAPKKRLPPTNTPPPADGTAIVAAGPKAMAIRRLVVGGLTALWGAVQSKPWCWKDHVTHRAQLKHYLDANISVTDLRASGALRTYSDLVHRFGFSPVNLAANRKLFTANQLRELFNIGWEELLIDFGVSPYLYLAVFKLPLEDLASLGIDLPVLMQWDTQRVYRDHGVDPTHGPTTTHLDYSDAIVANLTRALDRDLFLRCGHYEPTDWNLYMNMTYRDLRRLGVTAEDLMQLWHDRYSTLEDILTAFGWDRQRTKGQLPHGFTFATADASKTRQPKEAFSAATTAPGSLRQMRSQDGGGDNLFEDVRWDVDTDLLDPVSSGDTTSSEEEAPARPNPPFGRQRPREPSPPIQDRPRGHRRRRTIIDDADEGFGDIFPAISNLLAGPPAPPLLPRSNRQQRKKRQPRNDARERRPDQNPKQKQRRKKDRYSGHLPALDD